MNLENIEFSRNTDCPVCRRGMKSIFAMARYPITELYEPYSSRYFSNLGFVDQGFLLCEQCGHGKLETIISPAFLYSNYRTYTASSVGSMHAIRDFQGFIDEYIDLAGFDAIVDIGANDATLLSCFLGKGKSLIAIDPNANKNLETEHGIQVFDDFIENVDLGALKARRKLFLSSHTLEHIENPAEMLGNIRRAMGKDDVCAFQFPSLDLLLRDARFDQVHHQHIHYFSERSISILLAQVGFELVETRFDSSHYGTLMILFKPSASKTIKSFGVPVSTAYVEERKRIFDKDMSAVNLRLEYSQRGLVAFGAALMLPLLAYYLPALERIECILDDDRSKEGFRYVNFNKRIQLPADFSFSQKDVVITAVSTKLALRRVLEKLFKMNIENIIIPINQI
jgi:hypothetical protein